MVSPSFSHWITIDPSKKLINANFRVFYAKTAHKREDIPETENPNDFRIDDKYAAVILETNNLEDFYYLYTTIENEDSDKEFIKKKITEKLVYYLKRTSSGKGLDFLYRNIPEIAIEDLYEKLDKKLLLRHLYILKSFDENSNVLDSSGSLINLLRLFCQKDTSFLLEVCKKHPQMVKELYINMDDSSLFEGNLVPNRSLLVNLIYALCIQHGFKDLKKIQHVYRMGKGYFPDSNVLSGNDAVKDKIFLKQYYRKVTHSTQAPQDSADETGFQPFESLTITTDIPKTNGEYYYPLDLVRFIDMESEDDDPVWVPAILVKYFADTQEWKDIMDCVRVGADLLAIIIGIATLGSGTPLMMALAVGDIGLSVSDLWVALNEDEYLKTPEGREFLATWNKIMLLGGIVTAGPLLLDTAFTSGTKLFSRATLAGAKAETKNFLRASLMKIILEKNIIFSKNSLIILDTGTEIFTQSRKIFRILQATELQKAGVVFAKLQQTIDGKVLENGFAVFYKGELLVMGEAKKVREALKDVWALKGAKLIAKLDELWEQIPKLDASGKHWIATNKAGVSLKWANQKGNITHSIEAALKKTNDAAVLWEGKVAKEVSNYEEVVNFRNKISASKLDSPGELDIESKQFIFECKSSLSVGVLNSGRLEKQLIKFIDSAGEEYINLHSKKVVLVIESFGDGVSINHPILKRIAKKHGITIIEGISGIKKLY